MTARHITDVIALLNERADYAVCRNYEGLPYANKSRDIDIFISPKSFKAIRNDLERIFVREDWKIIVCVSGTRRNTYVCAKTVDSHAELIQWDFFINSSAYGILLLDASECLVHREFNGFLYHLSIEYQFLDKYMYNKVVGGEYPKKYNETRLTAEHSTVVTDKLKSLFGVDSVEECDRLGRRKLLMRAFLHNLKKRPLSLVADMSRFLWCVIVNYICSNTGFSIGFTGPDGSGKTTVIDLMMESLGPVFRSASVCCHFRPTLFGNLGDVAHSAGLKKEVDHKYDDPHRGGRTGTFSSLLRLWYYSVDYILGHFIKVKAQTCSGRIVIFDRYYTDIICDSRRTRIHLNRKFLYIFGRLFIPKLDYNILLTASTDTILSRKAELDREGIDKINDNIVWLAGKKGYTKILNESTPEVAIASILQHVFECQNKKNLNRLRYR